MSEPRIDNATARSRGDKVTIKIPRPLYQKIAQVIDGAGYNSVTDFVVYVMRDMVASHELSQQKDKTGQELEGVKEKLRALGYL